MFYKPVWEYGGCQLVSRPDTPNYFIYWTPSGGSDGRGPRARRLSTRTSDLEAAKRQLVNFVRERERLRPVRRAAESMPVLDVLCDYVELRSDGPRPYRPAHFTALKHFTAFVEESGLTFVADFGLDAQQRYIDWRRSTMLRQGYTASNGTLNRELGVLKAALRAAWKRGRLETPPHVQFLRNPPPRDRFLRPEEVRRLIDACEAWHLRLFVMLALHTLQRPIGIFSLRVEQVDLRWGRIDFLPSGAVQSNKRRPVVPITPSLRPYLETAIESSEQGYVVEYLGRPVCSVKAAFASACRRSGLKDVTPYTLRHTGATLMAAAGVPMRQIAGMLGHAEQRTTELYAKHHPDFLRDAASTLERLFGDTANAGTQGPGPNDASGNETMSGVALEHQRAVLAPTRFVAPNVRQTVNAVHGPEEKSTAGSGS